MIFRSAFLAIVLILVAFSSVDAFFLKETYYTDENCTIATGAYAFGDLGDSVTAEQCAAEGGVCELDYGVISRKAVCVDEDPLLTLPSDHIAALGYSDITKCKPENNSDYSAAIAGPIDKCVYASSLFGYLKVTGCGANQNATGTFYNSADDCAKNFNGTTYSYPPKECHIFRENFGLKFICPPIPPMAPVAPLAAPVAAPVAAPSSKKASTATSTSTFGLISCATAWIVATVV